MFSGNDITVRQFVEVGVMGGRLRKNFLYVSSVNYFSNPLKGEGMCSVRKNLLRVNPSDKSHTYSQIFLRNEKICPSRSTMERC